jgi:hypothetical protein
MVRIKYRDNPGADCDDRRRLGRRSLVQTALGRSLLAWRSRRIDDPRAFVRKVMVNRYASLRRRHAAGNG